MKEPLIQTDECQIIPEYQLKYLRWLMILATLLFLVGLFLPMITISKFIIVKNEFSVISGILELFSSGQYLLFIVVAGFSIILPLLKITVLFKLIFPNKLKNPKTQQYLKLMHEYGRWAMLDVMVVAVLIVTVKLKAIASVKVHIGLYIFGASVLLLMLITNKIVKLTKKNK